MYPLRIVEIYIVLNAETQLRQTDIIFDFDVNKLTPLWDEMFPAERNRLMHLLLKKVTLYEDHLDLDIRTAGVEQILEELDYEDHD